MGKGTDKKIKLSLVFSIVLLIASVGYTAAIALVDVQPIGPQDSSVGMAFINEPVFRMLYTSNLFDKFTDVLLGISALVALYILLQGFMQLRKKGLKKVDPDYRYFVIILIVLVVLYAVFELVTLNCRPILDDGALEASFPSSHALACCTIMGCVAVRAKEHTDSTGGAALVIVLCVTVIIFMTGGRVISGQHWFTDVTCGTLYALTLAAIYAWLCSKAAPKLGKHAR